MNQISHQRINSDLLRPLFQTSWRFYLLVGLFGSVVLIALVAWLSQAYFGFGITGIRWPIYWGFYVTNFVFWIGISHAGTLISAILRLVDAGWRRPVTRCAEVITVFALMIGALFPIIHLGRPWLAFWLFPYPSERLIWPNFRSPLVWDFFAINTYLTGSVLFLFLPMIPDFAVVRDKATGLRKRIYGVLALGWRGTPKQWHRLESAMSIMAVAIVPVAVSVHTIVSFDFSMAPVPMWQTTIFGPYFVAGAIFSGIAGLLIAMALLRRFLHLQEYLLPIHFQNLGKLLLVMALLWGYFVFNERLVTYYGNEPSEMAVFWRTQRESFAPLYWTMVIGNFVLPVVLMGIKYFRTITGCVIASIGVIVGMWLERFLIIVPSLGHKYLPYTFATYRPQPVEIIIAIATFAAMTLLYVLFAKFVPIISIWELKTGGPSERMGPTRQHSSVGPVLLDRPRDCDESDLRTLRRWAVGAAGGQPSARSGRDRPRDCRHLRAADGGVRVRPHGQQDADLVDRLPRWSDRNGDRIWFGVADRDVVAHQRWRAASLRVVAEPDHHLRVDDARRDPRDRDHARRHCRSWTAVRRLRSCRVGRKDPGRRRESDRVTRP
jgi:Ni/Fe-hydrogenase subunit HybB-like protein